MAAAARQRLQKDNLRRKEKKGIGKCGRDKERERERDIWELRQKKVLGYGNLGKGCATKKGKRTAKHEKGERKTLNF